MRSAGVRCFSLSTCLMFGAALLSPLAFMPLISIGSAWADSADDQWNSEEPPNAADELLQDGLDALADGRSGLAREAFEYLVEHHPASAAAPRARDELRRLNGGSIDDVDSSAAAAPPAPDLPSEPETVLHRPDDQTPAAPYSTPVAVPSAAPREPKTEISARPAMPAVDIQSLQSEFTRKVGDRVFFAESNAGLGGNAKSMLSMQARWLATKPAVAVHIAGHADDLGSAASNIDLSKRRAEAVRDFLISSGIDAARISIEVAGSGQPIALCSDAACRSQNRRAVATLRPFTPPPRTAAAAPPRANGAQLTPRADIVDAGTPAAGLGSGIDPPAFSGEPVMRQ